MVSFLIKVFFNYSIVIPVNSISFCASAFKLASKAIAFFKFSHVEVAAPERAAETAFM